MKGLSQECMTLFGMSLMTAFKFKFYEYSFAECRLMDMNDVTIDAYAEPFKHRIIDIFCVAAHYSQRYENAERFLNTQCKDTVTHERVLYLKHNPEDKLIAKFVSTCEPSPHNSVSISWKNMLYLWKVFIDDERIPNVFFVNALKARLTQHLPHYSETADAFLQLTSKHLPLVSRFNDFWTHHIAVNANDEDELEIDEFTALFKRYHHQQHQHANVMQTTPMQSHNHTDAAFLGLIRHFCPDVVIENDKHLMHVNCKLWDKRGEVVSAMQEYVEQAQLLGVTSPTSVYKAYEYYCQQQRAKNHASTFHHLIVSKKYFEKICSDNGF